MPPEDCAQGRRNTLYALFEGPYLTLGRREKRRKAVRPPTFMLPGHNAIHPRSVAEPVHRLMPQARWAEVRPPAEAPDQDVRRVLQWLAAREASAQEQPRGCRHPG